MRKKLEVLKKKLEEYKKVVIAYSAGVDSSFLLKVAIDTLGRENVIAVTAYSDFTSEEDIYYAEDAKSDKELRYIRIPIEILDVPGVKENPIDRCYICKKAIFSKIIEEINKIEGSYCVICEGSNADDLSDYRPGRRAIEELGIKSPLLESGLTKKEIRALSKELGIRTHDRPSKACLVSRIAYGQEITKEMLKAVDKAEQFLISKGYDNVRVRVHGTAPNVIARIEVPKDKISEVVNILGLAEYFEQLGFAYVTVDLNGFKSGSMNKAIGIKNE